MDIEKLIEAVKLCGSTPKVDQCKRCAYWAGGDMSKCIPRMTTAAATALSTLQAENERLRKELEYEREHANAYHEECGQWEAENEKLRAELESVRAERNAAIPDLTYIARTYPVDLCDDLVCQYCKHYPNVDTGCPGWTEDDCFEWRGVQNE